MSNYEQLSKEDFKAVLEKEHNAFASGAESFDELKFQYFENDVFYYKGFLKKPSLFDDESYSIVLGIELPKTRGKKSDRLGATVTINHVLRWLGSEYEKMDYPKQYTLYLDFYDNQPDGTDNDNEPFNYKSISTCLKVGEKVSV